MPGLSLVLPVYQGAPYLAERLAEVSTWLAETAPGAELLVVDDGSTDGTRDVLAAFAKAPPAGLSFSTFRFARNQGKGKAVRAGLLAARGRLRVFVDADRSYPVANVARIVSALESGADVAIADRAHPESRWLGSGPGLARRRRLSRWWRRAVTRRLLPDLPDTQAGLKGFTADAAERVFGRCTLDGWAFDVEALVAARAQGLSIAPVPVDLVWTGDPSTLRPWRDGWRMLRDARRVRKRLRRGAYDARAESTLGTPAREATSA